MLKIIKNYPNYCHIFTDGSKDNNKNGYAAIRKKKPKTNPFKKTNPFLVLRPMLCRSNTYTHLEKQQKEFNNLF